MFKLYCKNPFRKIVQAVKDFFDEIHFEQSHCYMCKRELTENEIKTAKRWFIGGDNHTVPVCDACVKETIESWNKQKERYLLSIIDKQLRSYIHGNETDKIL